MSQNRLSTRKRQLAHLSSHIRSLSGVWHELSASYRARLLSTLERLHSELRRFIPVKELKRILAGVAIFLGASHANESLAQNFATPVANVAGLSLNGITIPEFADIDNDGDLDLFVSNYDYGLFTDIAFFENTGSATNPSWGPGQTNPFGFTPSGNSYSVAPTLVDIDDDGDLDLFLSEYLYADGGAAIVLRENIGTATNPQFGPSQVNPFGLVSSEADAQLPEFADIDGDGDYDLLTLDYDSYGYFMQVWENTGTPSAAAFSTPQPNPLSGIAPFPGTYNFPALGDLDWDGDLDLLVCNADNSSFSFHENMLNSQTPDWTTFGIPNPFGLVPSGDDVALPTIVDIDGDGDMDIVAGGYYNGLWFYENLDISIGVSENEASTLAIFPNPAENMISIDISEIDEATVEIFDAQGRLIRSLQKNAPQMNVDVSELASGVYHVKAFNAFMQRTQKLIVK